MVLYDQLLAYATGSSSSVPRNKIDKAIGNIVDRLANSSAQNFTEQILSKTADAFRPLPDQVQQLRRRLEQLGCLTLRSESRKAGATVVPCDEETGGTAAQRRAYERFGIWPSRDLARSAAQSDEGTSTIVFQRISIFLAVFLDYA